MAPACGLDDRRRFALAVVELAEPGVSIGLENAGIVGEMPSGVLAAAIGRVEEYGCRRIRPAEWPVVADIRP